MKKSLPKIVSDWFSKYKQYVLFYRNSFWEIPYLSNSPETIVKSILKMPFTKHEPKRQHVISKTPLIRGSFYYENIETGLWLIHNKLQYKSNINYIPTGGTEEINNWYLLNLVVFGVKQKVALMDGIPYTNCSWTLYKPNSWATNCHFNGAEENAFTFYFHKDWLRAKFQSNQILEDNPIRHFFNSDASFEIWNDSIEQCKPYYQKIVQNFDLAEVRSTDKKQELKESAHDLLNYFFSIYEMSDISSNHFKVSDKVRVSMYRVEKVLLERLGGPFPGLDFLTKEANISETSLKVNFKLIFGTSAMQYFQQKQMLLAKEILLQEKLQINQLALKLGYKNPSKFTAAFKKHHGILPSDFLEK